MTVLPKVGCLYKSSMIARLAGARLICRFKIRRVSFDVEMFGNTVGLLAPLAFSRNGLRENALIVAANTRLGWGTVKSRVIAAVRYRFF